VRNCATTEEDKNVTYTQYGIPHPSSNTGTSQVCELDHLISLELGGADTLDNIWPQCGPNHVTLAKRYFKQKDAVENYLAEQVRTGQIELQKAQTGIASDWTQFLGEAQAFCAKNPAKCKGGD
jgi:DNA-directed RNA polymerase subunit L